MIQVGNREIKYCEHMVHNSNLNSIFTHGLLSHNQAHQKGLIKEDLGGQILIKKINGKLINKTYPLKMKKGK